MDRGNEDGQPLERLTVESAGVGGGLHAEHSTCELPFNWSGKLCVLQRACVDKRLQRTDIAVFAAIVDAANRKTGEFWAAIPTLVNASGVPRSTLIRALKRIEAAGYVRAERRHGSTTRYFITSSIDGTTSSIDGTSPSWNATGSAHGLSRGPVDGTKVVPSREHNQSNKSKKDVDQGKADVAAQPGAGGSLFGAADVLPNNASADRFAEFWQAYPRKVGKPQAFKAWVKLKADDQFDAVMAGLAAWAASPDWTKDGGKFIPHGPTFLSRRQWEDPAPKPVAASARARLPSTAYASEEQAAEIMRQRNGTP